MEELKKLRIRLSRYNSYLKSKVIRYWGEYGYQETPYIEMDYHYRINDKGYNKMICKMDNTAYQISKLLNL